MKKVIAMGLIAAFAVTSQSAVVEYWDFEDGSLQSGNPGPFTPATEANGSGYSEGVNGTRIHGWNAAGGLQFNSSTLGHGVGGNLEAYSDNMDGYIFDEASSAGLLGWSSASWTMQMHLRIDDMDGWETVLAKMGTSYAVVESDFYLQRRGDQGANGTMRLNYATADGTRTILDGSTVMEAGKWYGVAIVADDTTETISLYLDSGSGYYLDGQLTGQAQNLGVTASTANYALFRDYYDGGQWDNTDGAMDNLQIDNTALDITELRVVPEPATLGTIVAAGLGLLFIRRRFVM